MADNIRSAPLDDDEPHLDLRPLLRLAAWGGGAFLALALVVAIGRSETGERRAGAALASLTGAPTEQTLRTSGSDLLARAEAEREARRTAEALRTLAADRDRLAGRVAMLERTLEDLTGSIRRQSETPRQSTPAAAAAAAPASTPAPPPLPAAAAPPLTDPPATTASRKEDPAALPQIQAAAPKEPAAETAPATPAPAAATPPLAPMVNVPRTMQMALIQSYATATAPVVTPADPGAGSVAGRTQFAIDLGTAGSVNGLRALWEKTRTRQPAQLDGLRPLVSVRDGQRPGSTELRLVAGPLANASAAARLCATLVAAGIHCQPAVFDGQRLALR